MALRRYSKALHPDVAAATHTRLHRAARARFGSLGRRPSGTPAHGRTRASARSKTATDTPAHSRLERNRVMFEWLHTRQSETRTNAKIRQSPRSGTGGKTLVELASCGQSLNHPPSTFNHQLRQAVQMCCLINTRLEPGVEAERYCQTVSTVYRGETKPLKRFRPR